jgi:hypothetical protein
MKPTLTLIALCILVVLGTACHHGAAVEPVPSGPVIFAVPDVTDTATPFKIEIKRNYASDDEARLIQAAESAPPVDNPEDSPAEGGRREWWSRSFDGVRATYAVTGDALAYYLETIRGFQRDGKGPATITMKTGHLTYRATVEIQRQFAQDGQVFHYVRVVRLNLAWYQYCGNLCAMSTGGERVVVFDAEGKILAIFGDRHRPLVVS